MSLDARSDPHTVYAAVVRGFGLTRSELPPPHDGEGEVTPEGIGSDLVAAGTTDPYERLLATLANSEHGVAAPRHYWSEAPARHLRSPLAAFGYEFDLRTDPTGDGRTVAAVLRTDATVRRMTYTYPGDGDGTDAYPALVHAIEDRLLPEAGPTFVRLADDGDAWRFVLVERWRLAELRERFGDRIEVFGDALLSASQPAALAGEGDRPGDVDPVTVPTDPLDDAFERLRRDAVTEPVVPRTNAAEPTVDLDGEAAAALRGADAALTAGHDGESGPADAPDSDAETPGTGDAGDTEEGFWSTDDAETAPDRPRRRYAGPSDDAADPVADRGRFVPSDPPEMGVADPADPTDDRSGRHVADDADGVEELPESVTLDRSHATRTTGDGLPSVAADPGATSRDDPDDPPGAEAFVFGEDRGDPDPPADTDTDEDTDAGADRQADATPLSQQVASTLGEDTRGSSAESTPTPDDPATDDERDDEPVTRDHGPREWAGDDADTVDRPDGDVLSAITRWVEDER